LPHSGIAKRAMIPPSGPKYWMLSRPE